MYKEDAFFGLPIEVKNVCFIYPPRVKEIISLGYEVFNIYSSFLTRSQEDIDDTFRNERLEPGMSIPSPFIFLLSLMNISSEVESQVKKAFQFFTHEEIFPLYDLQMIIVGPIKEKRILNDQNFFEFQNCVRAAIGMTVINPPDPNEHPKIRQWKAKQRERDRIKNKQSGVKITQLSTLITSLCCMNMGINPMNAQDITFASINALIDRYQEKDGFENYIAVQLAGGNNKQQPYWIRDL